MVTQHKNQLILIVVVLLAASIIVVGGYKTLVGKATGTFIPNPPCLRGDLTEDGTLDAADLNQWLSFMEQTEKPVSCCVDLDQNGILTQNDYDVFFDALIEEKSLGACEG